MDMMMSPWFGVDSVPEGLPQALALSIAMNGYTKAEARASMKDGGDADMADEWITKLNNAGHFKGPSRYDDALTEDKLRTQSEHDDTDVGSLLWQNLLESLRKGESGFKHLVTVDNCIKDTGGRPSHELHLLCKQKAGEVIPFSSVQHNCPWNGCKFAGISIMHVISGLTSEAKRHACRTACRSLGGCTLRLDLNAIRWPYVLCEAFEKAALSVHDHATALFVHAMDVEVMRCPGKRQGSRFVERPGTFAHVFVMTISQVGVYLYQAYGPGGYTLLQYMEMHEKDFPLSLEEGQLWVRKFESFAADPFGMWSEQANEAYTFCFDVDLEKLGCMKNGSQMDVYVQVEEHELDASTVQSNFSLLPIPDSTYPKCIDGSIATAKKSPVGYRPYGGVPHYYIPTILRCGRCGRLRCTANVFGARKYATARESAK